MTAMIAVIADHHQELDECHAALASEASQHLVPVTG